MRLSRCPGRKTEVLIIFFNVAYKIYITFGKLKTFSPTESHKLSVSQWYMRGGRKKWWTCGGNCPGINLLYLQDRWICQLCLLPVDCKLHWPILMRESWPNMQFIPKLSIFPLPFERETEASKSIAASIDFLPQNAWMTSVPESRIDISTDKIVTLPASLMEVAWIAHELVHVRI